jgi:hypothetical protein
MSRWGRLARASERPANTLTPQELRPISAEDFRVEQGEEISIVVKGVGSGGALIRGYIKGNPGGMYEIHYGAVMITDLTLKIILERGKSETRALKSLEIYIEEAASMHTLPAVPPKDQDEEVDSPAGTVRAVLRSLRGALRWPSRKE